MIGDFVAFRVFVSIHAPVKGRPACLSVVWFGACFNPRPREGATANYKSPNDVYLFQSTPREGATRNDQFLNETVRVSIHAPVKGRRRGFAENGSVDAVSIHAPVKGRPPVFPGEKALYRFNPRPR